MRRRNHKASPVPGGHVRRSGPKTCMVGVMPGMHIEELVRLQLAGQLFAGVLSYGVDVSWSLWAEFIEHNHEWQAPEHYSIPGNCLMPDDAVAFLEAMATEYSTNSKHARTY